MTETTEFATFTRDFREVQREERKRIGRKEAEPLVGLALSGGGIRSASFALGVLHALVRAGHLSRVDYLSTVSGGGYIGSCLTWCLTKNVPGPAGTDAAAFPLGNREDPGARDGQSKQNLVLNFIRQHGSYLVPGRGLDFASLIAVALRAMVVSLLFYVCLLSAGMMLLRSLGFFDPAQRLFFWSQTAPAWFNWGIGGACALVALFLLGSVAYAVGTCFSRAFLNPYAVRTQTQRWFGRVLAGGVVLLALGSLPLVVGWIAAPSVGLGSWIGLLHFRRSSNPEGAKGPLASSLIPVVGALLLLYGLFLGAYVCAVFLAGPGAGLNVAWWIVFALVILTGLCLNSNYLAPARMYRDRLMETFLPDPGSVESNRWGLATEADAAPIHAMSPREGRPYHLVNANVILADSKQSKFHGRGGDSFLLSPLYCGSDATGWRSSASYMGSSRGRGMTLATAMAISGAAVNPNAGAHGSGPTTNRWVSTLMSILCLRLGYWAPNPDLDPDKRTTPRRPNLFSPGLRGSVLTAGMSEEKRWIELSDGGHFENLGIYELVRREADVILVSDAGADPGFQFADLANAVERCRVDFNAIIHIPEARRDEKREDKPECKEDENEEYPLGDLLPGSAAAAQLDVEKYGLARCGFAVGKILYRSGKEGTLFFLKTTMVEGLSPDVYGYKNDHPSFPDQSTADQFFDEAQLEAYRELGYGIGLQCTQSSPWRKAWPAK